MDKGYEHIEQAPLRNLEVFDAQYMKSLEVIIAKRNILKCLL